MGLRLGLRTRPLGSGVRRKLRFARYVASGSILDMTMRRNLQAEYLMPPLRAAERLSTCFISESGGVRNAGSARAAHERCPAKGYYPRA
jgi:hypothetical protein